MTFLSFATYGIGSAPSAAAAGVAGPAAGAIATGGDEGAARPGDGGGDGDERGASSAAATLESCTYTRRRFFNISHTTKPFFAKKGSGQT